jgi:DNA repair protein RadD
MKIIPRSYQVEAVKSIFDFFTAHQNPSENPVVALPTGTGKSIVIADFLQQAFGMYAHQKVLIATHVKELIAQNYAEFMGMWPTAPAGIYSAGLKRKDVNKAITFCGIASIAKKLYLFGKIDLIIIDECHLLSQDDESMYLKAIQYLKDQNPLLRIIGLTATPWRAGQGKITDDGIFTHICFDLTTMACFNRFIKEGFLAPLIPKSTETLLDVSGVHMLGGDFKQGELELAVNKDEVTFAALTEAVQHGYDRNHWLVFGSGIKHVERITEMLNHLGVSARCVHSKMPSSERDNNIRDWKLGLFKAIVNNGILTTGVNFKPIDLIVMLRPTSSTVLWIQMLGRGTRPSPETGKDNCLVMDFAQNTQRLGPINDPVLPRKKGESKGEVPIKICETCDMYNHISARYCGGQPYKTNEGCGSEFLFKVLIKQKASSNELIKNDEPIVVDLAVDNIQFALHKKPSKPDCMKVTYNCGLSRYNEYILFEHVGFGQRKAATWWRARTAIPVPQTTEEALAIAHRLMVPNQVKVWVNKPYPEILNITFPEVPF